MLKLYHSPGSYSSRIVWLLEELGAPYELIVVRYPDADGRNADPRNPHPHGYTPALDHDGCIVSETGAIALYLTDLYPASTLSVPVGHPLRGVFLTWLFYEVGLTEPLLYLKGGALLSRDASMSQLNEDMMRHIEATLSAGPYLLGERFTAVDILFMSLFEKARPLLGPSAVLDAYLVRADRPAKRRAMTRGG